MFFNQYFIQLTMKMSEQGCAISKIRCTHLLLQMHYIGRTTLPHRQRENRLVDVGAGYSSLHNEFVVFRLARDNL